jgi:hypothetical protein
MNRKSVAIVSLAALSTLAAAASCGKEGALQRPGPVFGGSPSEKAAYAAQKANEAAAASNASMAGKPIGPQSPALQPYVNTAPPRDLPIPGEPTPPSSSQGGTGVVPP